MRLRVFTFFLLRRVFLRLLSKLTFVADEEWIVKPKILFLSVGVDKREEERVCGSEKREKERRQLLNWSGRETEREKDGERKGKGS